MHCLGGHALVHGGILQWGSSARLLTGAADQARLVVDLIYQGEAEICRDVPKSAMPSVTERIILNPGWVCSSIIFLKKSVDFRDRVEEWKPLPMEYQMVLRDHLGLTSTGKPLSV